MKESLTNGEDLRLVKSSEWWFRRGAVRTRKPSQDRSGPAFFPILVSTAGPLFPGHWVKVNPRARGKHALPSCLETPPPPGCLASSSKLKPPNRSCFVSVMPSLRNSVGATEQPYGARGDRQLSWKLGEGALCPAQPGPQFSSVTLSCLFATPWTVACQASLSITNSWRLLKLMSIELVMPFNHLVLCHPLLLPSVFPSIRVFSNEPVLRIKVAKALELQLQHQSF